MSKIQPAPEMAEADIHPLMKEPVVTCMVKAAVDHAPKSSPEFDRVYTAAVMENGQGQEGVVVSAMRPVTNGFDEGASIVWNASVNDLGGLSLIYGHLAGSFDDARSTFSKIALDPSDLTFEGVDETVYATRGSSQTVADRTQKQAFSIRDQLVSCIARALPTVGLK